MANDKKSVYRLMVEMERVPFLKKTEGVMILVMKIEITGRDEYLFKLLNKFRVLDAELILKFSDYTDLKHVQRRLIQLTEERYIGRERDGNTTPYIYFLRQRGMNVLNEKTGDHERPYVIRNFSQSSLSHELLVAEICYTILANNKELELDDIQTDRELRKLGYDPKRIGDIRIPKFKVNIEVENTQKTFKRYVKKFAMTEDGFGHLWILNGFSTLKFKLNDYIRLRITDRHLRAILLTEVATMDFDLREYAERYQRQQQFIFDEQKREREAYFEEEKRMEHEAKEMAERERRILEENMKKKPFWRK
ncbi:replication-relaxation family protein [Erysipelothrix aquatica]|uniref:replication-relaxation family protein n=1 Tax=Erysipelothrix aquatica TaxID=2683714 RepID=UPI001357991F|nr:replication-relaxation family protein [Erysipelothrix aquatica]